MSTMVKLAFRNIKENKKWATMTVLGISVSLMLITMLFSFATGAYHSLSSRLLLDSDTWNESIMFNIDQVDNKMDLSSHFKNRPQIERFWVQSEYDVLMIDDYEVNVNLVELQEHFVTTNPPLRFSIPVVSEGRLAGGPDEIAITKQRLGNKKIGDTVQVGDEIRTIVGVLSSQTSQVSGAEHRNDIRVFIEYKDGTDLKAEKVLNEAIPGYQVSEYHTIINSLRGLSLPTNEMFWTVAALCLFFVVIISLSSISLIYNAFYLSLEQKVQQIGVLKSVGATNKQIGKMVYFEGILLSLISITIGIAGGYYLAGVALSYVATAFSNIANQVYFFKPSLSFGVIIAIYIVGIITVLLPIRKSVKFANKVSPVEIIRNISKNDEKISYKKVPHWISKHFGTSGTLSYKNYFRDRQKHRSTSISLIIVIILFISISSFVETAKTLENFFDGGNYDIQFNTWDSSDDFVKEYRDIQDRIVTAFDAEDVDRFKHILLTGINNEFSYTLMPKYDKKGVNYYLPEQLTVYNDADFVKYFGGDSLYDTVFVPSVSGKIQVSHEGDDYSTMYIDDQFVDVKVGETYDFGFWDYQKNEVEPAIKISLQIDRIAKEMPTATMNSYGNSGIGFVISESRYQELQIDDFLRSTNSPIHEITLIRAQEHELVEDQIRSIIEEGQYNNSDVLGFSVYNKTTEQLLLSSVLGSIDIASIIMSAFIIIICISNLLNVLSSTSRQRLKEYGVYRSVGMNVKELRKMLWYESILNTIKPLIIGVLSGIGITYIIFKILKSVASLESFRIDKISILQAIIMVILIQSIQLISSTQLLKRSNIVRDLKRMEM